MVEELKSEARKLTNLIGFKGKKDVTSRAFTLEMIEALEDKYKQDLRSSVRLRRLEFYHDLIENARHKQRESIQVEESFVLSDKKKKRKQREEHPDEEEGEHEKVEVEEEEEGVRLEDEVVVKTEEIDEWKNLMTLAKVYYLMEHPNSEGLAWKRRTKKRKTIKKFTDKDLIEWYVAQHFRLKGLEEWAVCREQARKLSEESPFDFDDMSEDDESRELEDMFHVMEAKKQKKRKMSELEKALNSKRPFKITDETIEDWTESYSDDSEEPGADEMFYRMVDLHDDEEEPDMKVKEFESPAEEDTEDEEDLTKIFSTYKEIEKHRNPAFDKMDEAQKMDKWYDLCDKTMKIKEPPAKGKSRLKVVGFFHKKKTQAKSEATSESPSKEPEGAHSETEETPSEKDGIYFSNDISPEEAEKKIAEQLEEELAEDLKDKMTMDPKEGEEEEDDDAVTEEIPQEDDEFQDALDESFEQEESQLQLGRKYFVSANWKEGSHDEVYSFIRTTNICPLEDPLDSNTEVVLGFPNSELGLARCIIPSDGLATQSSLKGSEETSSKIIKDERASWIIIHQGERNIELAESNALIAENVGQAQSEGLKVIACVGESLEEKESGATLDVIFSQTKAIVDEVSDWSNIVLAYEPAWEMESGETLDSEVVQSIHSELRNWLRENVSEDVANKTRVIYGGSVSSTNCKEFAAKEDIDGFLLGRSSLEADEFKRFVNINK